MSDTGKTIPQYPPRQPPWPAELVAPLPKDRFAKNEEWAWARIANGLDADMTFYPGDDADPQSDDWLTGRSSTRPDVNNTTSFKQQHRLSEVFLRTILFHEPWSSAPERPSVRIFYAQIEDVIDWSTRVTRGALWLDCCRFEQDVILQDLQIRGVLSMEPSTFVGRLAADRLQVDGSLFCRGMVAERDVSFLGARIGSQAAFDRATFKGVLEAERLQVEDDFYLREMTRLGPTFLAGAIIGGDLQLRESQIEGVIDLTGVTIAGELHLDKGWDVEREKGTLPNWGVGAKLVLRNASAASIAGQLNAFRRKRENEHPERDDFVEMNLTGFRYQRLGGLQAEHGNTLAAAEAAHLIAWLEAGCGDDIFNPDPYRQLARALEASGHMGKARRILHAMADHERRCAKGRQKIPFFFSQLFIGYGYSNLRAIGWFLLLVFAFAVPGFVSETTRGFEFGATCFGEFFRWLGFSFANAVPLMNFDKAHETFLAAQFGNADDPGSVPVGIAWAFYLEKVLGFIILTYLAAGLSGLAHRRVEEG